PDPAEVENAKKEFGVIESPTWATPGTLRRIDKDPNDQRELQTFLEQQLLTSKLRCQLEQDREPVPVTNKNAGKGDSLVVTRDKDSLIPSIPLKADSYTARVRPIAPQDLDLAPGDFTVFAVRAKGYELGSMYDLESAWRKQPLPESGTKNPDWK